MKKRCILIIIFFAPFLSVKGQLTGMSPNQAALGQTLQTTITGSGIFIQTSSPSGNLFQIRLLQGGSIITLFDYNNFWNYWSTSVMDPNTVITDVIVPLGTPAGTYDLEVITGDVWDPWWNQAIYTLPAAFTVLSPDGYISGTVYSDLNKNGNKDAGEPGLPNRTIKINPSGFTLTTDASGNYSYAATNGNHTVIIQNYFFENMFVTSSNDTLTVTINNANSGGNDFGLKHALVSVTPNIGYKGVTTIHQFVADEPIFVPGGNAYGNVVQMTVLSSPSVNVSVSSSVTVIDSFTIRAVITIPAGTGTGNNLDVRVYLNTGYHFLKQQFNILSPPAFISGTLFYDQNQNKIFDAGEPGISGGKVSLMPDSTYAFSDIYGNFSMTSPGGAQTLAYENNLPGISLYTDSASYTFTAAGNITGKNFGFISTGADYSILVNHLHFFARCNSPQLVMFRVRNVGNIAYGARVWLKTGSNMNFIWSVTPPSSISNDTIYWDIPNILPGKEVHILPLFLMPATGIGSVTASASSLDVNGIVQDTDTQTRNNNVFCACDPNDKTVTPPGLLAEHFTLMTDTLINRIRFQNTGNDTAFNVVILDTLDSDLDLETFEILESSHSVKTQLLKNGALKFSFNNILLVDSNTNEAGSHGYILYRIMAKSGLADSTKVLNTAHIFFDFNPDVITNTTLNTLVYMLPDQGPLPVQLISFTGIPENDFNFMEWVTLSELNNHYFDLERSMDGTNFVKQISVPGNGTTSSISEYSFRDYDVEETNYYYRLKQVDYDGAVSYPGIILVKRQGEYNNHSLTVFPNPFTSSFTLGFSNPVKASVTIELYDLIGKLIRKESFIGGAMGYTIDFSESDVSKGAYLLKVTTAGEVKTFKVFKQ